MGAYMLQVSVRRVQHSDAYKSDFKCLTLTRLPEVKLNSTLIILQTHCFKEKHSLTHALLHLTFFNSLNVQLNRHVAKSEYFQAYFFLKIYERSLFDEFLIGCIPKIFEPSF